MMSSYQREVLTAKLQEQADTFREYAERWDIITNSLAAHEGSYLITGRTAHGHSWAALMSQSHKVISKGFAVNIYLALNALTDKLKFT